MQIFTNHYRWLEAHLNTFWLQVFGKGLSESWCGGIIGAHGDKGYQYRDEWEEAGIPFYHGMAIYLLSYTEEFPQGRCRSTVAQWVIEEYPKYKPMLPPVLACVWHNPTDGSFSNSWCEYEYIWHKDKEELLNSGKPGYVLIRYDATNGFLFNHLMRIA